MFCLLKLKQYTYYQKKKTADLALLKGYCFKNRLISLLPHYFIIYFLLLFLGNNSEAQEFLSRGGKVIIRMRGLPYDCTQKQVVIYVFTSSMLILRPWPKYVISPYTLDFFRRKKVQTITLLYTYLKIFFKTLMVYSSKNNVMFLKLKYFFPL